MAKEYYDNYVGIVITGASEDPEGRNRVQVWVPHVMNTLYKNWNNNEDNKIIFNLNQNGLNIPPDELERLRNSLPWAECASPLMGGGAPFSTNRETEQTGLGPAETFDENFTNDENVPTAPDNSSLPPEPEDQNQAPPAQNQPPSGGGSSSSLPPAPDDATVPTSGLPPAPTQ